MAISSRAGLMLALMLLPSALVVQGVGPSSAVDLPADYHQPQTISMNDGGLIYSSQNQEIVDIPAVGSATPYPSQITVDHPGAVRDVDVDLSFSHQRPDDIDLLLVGPQGQSVVLMSDAGGTQPVRNAELYLDDDHEEYDEPIPDNGPLGRDEHFRPANYDDGPDDYPAPAPTPGTGDLSTFDGSSAAGVWSLYAVDDSAEKSGAIIEWSLHLDVASTAYPSELQVSGIGPVTDVDVSLHGFDTQYASDVSLLLVGPHGQQSLLLNDASGVAANAASGLELRFDDEAPSQAPENEALRSGSYQPTSYDDDTPADALPPPAPAAPGPEGAPTLLSVFDGTDPNGTWRLFAYDDSPQDFTVIHGWSLHIRWADVQAPSGSIVVGGGSERTQTRDVRLDLAATDASPATGVTQMRLSNKGVKYATWQPYATEASWRLSRGEGTKRVWVQFRDSAGNVSKPVRDKIVFDSTAPRATKTRPTDAARSASPHGKIKIWSSERLLLSSVDATTVRLTKDGSTVAAKVAYDAARWRVVVDPRQDLQPGTYRLKVTTKVQDLAGNRWDQRDASGRQPLIVVFQV